jgi:hypothetical protein
MRHSLTSSSRRFNHLFSSNTYKRSALKSLAFHPRPYPSKKAYAMAASPKSNVKVIFGAMTVGKPGQFQPSIQDQPTLET